MQAKMMTADADMSIIIVIVMTNIATVMNKGVKQNGIFNSRTCERQTCRAFD